MKTSLKASLIALAIASFPIGSHAAGLGQINVFSGLGQPLRAEIAVSATAQELQSLTARIAPVEAFRAANLPYSATAAAVRVSVDTRAARPVIRLSTVRPVDDPFLELLVELTWASGQLAREYTFLLDPVDLTAPRPAAARVDAAPAAPAARVVTPPPMAREPAAAPASAVIPERYTVRRGDTLHSIAGNTAQPGANLDQMLIALFRANPGAFEGGNINRLKAGAVLSVPSAERVQAIDATEARREILAQATDFEAYRRRLAGAAGAQQAADAAPEQASAGRIVPRVEEARPAAESGDKLRVSRAEKVGDGDAIARLQALEEELASREKALQDANTRLAQLEQSIRDMQKLLEVRSASLAQAQQQAGGASPAATAPAAPATVPPPAPAVAAPTEPPPVPPAAASGTPAPEVKPEPVPTAVPEVAPAPKPQPKSAAVPPPPEEPEFIESLLGNPATLAAGGGIAALLLALVGLRLRKRRDNEAPGAEVTELAGETQKPEQGVVFGETGGQSVDTGNSVLMTDFSQSGLSAIDTDEGVDPVAEADVYMAYGRDAQAEEILQDALKADPDRTAIYLKLLEIYTQRKSLKQFETVATDLYARTGGSGPDWERAAGMGRKLDPDNPLYGPQGVARDAGRDARSTDISPAAAGLATAAGIATAAQARASEQGPASEGRPSAAAVDEPFESLSALDFTASLPLESTQPQLRETWTQPGELNRFAKDGEERGGAGAAPAAALGAVGAEPEEPPQELEVIDFDLGLDEPPLPPVVAAAASIDTQGQATADESAGQGLTFDLDIGDLDLQPAAAAAVPASLEDRDATASGASDMEAASAFDFDLPDLEFEPGANAMPDLKATAMDVSPLTFEPETTALGMDFESAAEAPGRIETGAADLQATMIESAVPDFDPDATALDLDFELPDMSASGAAAPAPVPQAVAEAPAGGGAAEMDLEKTSFDSSLLDFDFDIEPAASQPSAVPSLDLTSIDLDLDVFGEEAGPEPAPAVAPEIAAEAARPDNFEEIETKLELARAYEEMGDKEGALELLDEVLREGGAQQQASAREMVARLG